MRTIIALALGAIVLQGCMDPGNRTPGLELIKAAEGRSYKTDLASCKKSAREAHLRRAKQVGPLFMEANFPFYDDNVRSCLNSRGHDVNLTHTRPAWVNN